MAKSVYKIPTDLSISYLDQEIGLSNNSQAKPIQLRLLLSWLGSGFLGFWVLTQTFLKDAGPLLIAAFIAWWIAATVFYCRKDETQRLRLLGLADLPSYLPRRLRRVQVRSGSAAQHLLEITGVKRVEEPHRLDEPAMIVYRDGAVGHAYQVVGSASALLFEADKRLILDRVDAFYRKMDTSSEWLFVTLKRAQRVETQLRQLEQLRRRHQAEPPLVALIDRRITTLRDEVGRDYLSVQQYLIVRSDNRETLSRAHALVAMEAAESTLMLRSLAPLDTERTHEVLAELFAGR